MTRSNVVRLVIAAAVFGICSVTLADAQDEVQHDDSLMSRLLDIRGATSGGAEAALVADDGLYVAGSRWNKQDGKSLWLWRLDREGNKQWELPLDAQQRNEGVRVVGLLAGAGKFRAGPPSAGVRVVTHRGMDTKLLFVNAGGKVTHEQELGPLEDTHGLLDLGDGDTLLFGSSMTILNQPRHGWVSRVMRLGPVRWKQTYQFAGAEPIGVDESLQDDRISPDQMTFLNDAVLMEDGTMMLVGQTGSYNKFGAGPSQVFVIHFDGNGQRLGTAMIEDGRLCPSCRGLIVRVGDGVVVPYSTEHVGDLAQKPGGEFGMRLHLARFDAELSKVWDRHVTDTYMPGAVSLTQSSSITLATTSWGGHQLIRLDQSGEELDSLRFKTPDASLIPLVALRDADQTVALFNHRRTGDASDVQRLLVVRTTDK